MSVSVRLERAYILDDLCAGELYLCAFDLIDKALLFPDKWKHKLMAIGGYDGGHCVDCEIQRGPKIVNGIANHERPCVGDGFISFRNDQILASLRPVFDNQPKWAATQSPSCTEAKGSDVHHFNFYRSKRGLHHRRVFKALAGSARKSDR